jgi:carboxyl-terminal processing protease
MEKEEKKKVSRITKKNLGLTILMVCLFVVGFVAGRVFEDNKSAIQTAISGKSTVNFDLYWNVWDLMKSKYVDSSKATDQSMIYGSIKGMVDSFGDPATVFLDPDETKTFNEESEGNFFEGIGAELGYDNGQIIIITPLEGSPAKAAGIKAGDAILAIDGVQVDSTMSIYNAVDKIRGTSGTQVTLNILHKGATTPVDITITRSSITVPSMSLDYVGTNKDTALFKVNRFTDASYSDWTANWDTNVNAIVKSGVKKVILDLRGNPGGYLDAAVYAADDFIDSGKVIVEQEDSSGNIQKTNSTAGGRLVNMQVVVLVDSGSASAAEILTGALQQSGRATVIGDKTYGKGTAQSVISLSDGSSLHVTVMKWLLPDGNWLNKSNPITPDQIVSISDADFLKGVDTQLNAAISQLSK